jgi:hypothetical protein
LSSRDIWLIGVATPIRLATIGPQGGDAPPARLDRRCFAVKRDSEIEFEEFKLLTSALPQHGPWPDGHEPGLATSAMNRHQ